MYSIILFFFDIRHLFAILEFMLILFLNYFF